MLDRSPPPQRPSRRRRRARAGPAVAVLLVGLLAGCAPPVSDGGVAVVPAAQRVEEVRAARAVLAAPVPELRVEAVALRDALREVWTAGDEAARRARLATSLDLAPTRSAVVTLAALTLEGEGPDVVAARALVAELVEEGEALLAAVEREVAELASVAAFDAELLALPEGWDQRGSYSQQLAAFDELAATGAAVAADAAGRDGLVPCLEVWPRRAAAATVFVERTQELRALVRDRRGQLFDDQRDAWRQDPYGLGETLGRADAAAAAACWDDGSEVPPPVVQLGTLVDELAVVLDPAELRG